MSDKPPPCKGLSIRIPIVIPIKGRGVINHGSGLSRDSIGFRDNREYGNLLYRDCIGIVFPHSLPRTSKFRI